MKPVELVIQNTLHEVASRIEIVPRPARDDFVTRGDVGDQVARLLLCRLAHDAALPVVLKALAAIGGPATANETAQRLRAVLDQRHAQTAPPPAAPEGST